MGSEAGGLWLGQRGCCHACSPGSHGRCCAEVSGSSCSHCRGVKHCELRVILLPAGLQSLRGCDTGGCPAAVAAPPVEAGLAPVPAAGLFATLGQELHQCKLPRCQRIPDAYAKFTFNCSGVSSRLSHSAP